MARLTIPAQELMYRGHAACPGCGPALAMRLLLKGLGPRTILSIPGVLLDGDRHADPDDRPRASRFSTTRSSRPERRSRGSGRPPMRCTSRTSESWGLPAMAVPRTSDFRR